MDDLISRQEAIDTCLRMEAVTGYDAGCLIAQLPSADIEDIIASHEEIGYERGLRDGYAQAVTENDAESKWKPCSEVTGEGYPKEDGFYYVTERNYGFYLDADSKRNVVHTSHFNGDFTDRFFDENVSNIVAWMPLLKPYEGEDE